MEDIDVRSQDLSKDVKRDDEEWSDENDIDGEMEDAVIGNEVKTMQKRRNIRLWILH